MEKLKCYLPRLEDLWFRQRMMEDPATMAYNAGWDVDFEGYDRATGCITFPQTQWQGWYDHWMNQEPRRFYAYVQREADSAWLGEINTHYNAQWDWWEMGVVLYAPYRGRGYGVPALRLLLDHAFRESSVTRIHNDFEMARHEVAAWETHRKAGFRDLGVVDGFLQMLITREEYERQPSKTSAG